MYKTILVPHAGTPAGDEALKHAIHAAKETSAKIIILHIVEEIPHPRSFGLSETERENVFNSIHQANEDIRKGMEKEMEKRMKQCKDSNIESQIKVAIGDAAETILDVIDGEKVDLVIMAKRRKLKGMRKLLSMGSVSRKIVENTSCPVLLIDVENR
ncbi:MAG: universal stress protein [Nitrosopumilus sp.]|nr:universal stress protein [Nitrosopumilus sp.]MDH3853047.1 universal stress protein [Nitrosopumilus sp.]